MNVCSLGQSGSTCDLHETTRLTQSRRQRITARHANGTGQRTRSRVSPRTPPPNHLANRGSPMPSLITPLGGTIVAVCPRCHPQRTYEFPTHTLANFERGEARVEFAIPVNESA